MEGRTLWCKSLFKQGNQGSVLLKELSDWNTVRVLKVFRTYVWKAIDANYFCRQLKVTLFLIHEFSTTLPCRSLQVLRSYWAALHNLPTYFQLHIFTTTFSMTCIWGLWGIAEATSYIWRSGLWCILRNVLYRCPSFKLNQFFPPWLSSLWSWQWLCPFSCLLSSQL